MSKLSIEKNSILLYLMRFLQWCESKNYSQATNKTRDVCIKRFITWCEPRGIDTPQNVTKKVLEQYHRYLLHYRKADGKPLSFSTQHSHLAPLKAFFKWLSQENYILYNPAADFQLPRIPKRLPKDILSFDEINSLLNHTSIFGNIGIRDRAIMEVFYSTGVRRMELVGLRLQDFDDERGTLTIFDGKWKKDRVVPIGERAIVCMNKYLAEVRPKLIRDNDSGYIFLTDYGEAFLNNRISDLVKKYMNACGIEKRGSCHLFRHAMATHMLDNGADIRFIQAMLGHANLSSTEIYTQVSIKKLKQVHAATHPAQL